MGIETMTDTEYRLRKISRYLSLGWMALVALASLAGILFVFTPNEAVFVLGRGSAVAYALGFVLVVAVVGLPLLVVAAMLSRKAGRPES